MKILLVRPRDSGNINTRLPESLNRQQGVLPPLGISYVASALEKAGHDVRILDVIASNLSVTEVRRSMREFMPDVTGITVMTPTIHGALESAQMAKEHGSITVLGGPHLSVFPRETLSYSFVDFGVNGEGESVMLELVARLAQGMDFEDIQGLIYRKNGTVYVNAPSIVEEVDSLAFPAYHLLPMSKYNSIIGLHPVSTMISSRGCPYHCHFCFKQPSDKKTRFRSPASVVDEMEFLVSRYGVKEIMFYDDVMTANRSHVIGICEEILRRGLKVKWEAPARVEHVDESMLMLMRKSGCLRLRYGVESGDPGILELMNKGITLERIKNVFRMTKKAAIGTFAYFMIGYAHETPETLQRTIDFALELDPDLVMFTVVTPLPETPLYALARSEGLVSSDYWQEFTLGKRKAERIPYFVADAEQWVSKAYRKFYFRPRYILNQLSRIRSWDALAKAWRAFHGLIMFNMMGKKS